MNDCTSAHSPLTFLPSIHSYSSEPTASPLNSGHQHNSKTGNEASGKEQRIRHSSLSSPSQPQPQPHSHPHPQHPVS